LCGYCGRLATSCHALNFLEGDGFSRLASILKQAIGFFLLIVRLVMVCRVGAISPASRLGDARPRSNPKDLPRAARSPSSKSQVPT
jgi:hypothetical protein